VHPTYLVLSYGTLSNEIFCGSFLIKNHAVVFACYRSEMNFIPQPQEQESCGRQTQHSSMVFGCLCNQPVWCCDILLFISDKKSCCYFLPATEAKQILFLNHRNRKVVGGKHNIIV
jgi:hypothetical protein